jgi:GLPGLI family protein
MINIDGSGKQYKNLKDKVVLTESDIFDKEFLVKDSLSKLDWKLEKETKKIGTYTCHKATAKVKNSSKVFNPDDADGKAINILDKAEKEKFITAWYAPEIPVSQGPGSYWGLPGLILEVHDGSVSLLCSKVVLNPKQKIDITAPKKGKKISKAEFDKIVEQKTNEMMQVEEGRSDNKMMIKIGG